MGPPVLKVGTVHQIWRYPVSSLRGESLSEAEVGASGIAGDRQYGLFDAQSGAIASPDNEKRWRSAPQLMARLRGDHVEVSGDGEVWNAVDTGKARNAGAEALGFPVDFKRFGTPTNESSATAAPRYERAALHLLTTASMRALDALLALPGGADVRRFRPNLVIETGEEVNGFVEQDWIGQALIVGPARLAITEPCTRCSFVALAQGELSFKPPVLHAVSRYSSGGFGVLAGVSSQGLIRTGYDVFLD